MGQQARVRRKWWTKWLTVGELANERRNARDWVVEDKATGLSVCVNLFADTRRGLICFICAQMADWTSFGIDNSFKETRGEKLGFPSSKFPRRSSSMSMLTSLQLVNPEEEEMWDASGLRKSLPVLRPLQVEEQVDQRGQNQALVPGVPIWSPREHTFC